jgi:isochorismate pyruvate lyase
MAIAVQCDSLEMVRNQLDRIDTQMLTLLAERGAYVKQAASFKRNAAEVAAPQRIERVIAKVLDLAPELGADPHVAEMTWRAMMAAFIQSELAEHAHLHPPSTTES